MSQGEHWIFFGDGNVAKYHKKKQLTRPDGEKYIRFIIVPSADIVKQYNLIDEDPYYASSGMTIKEYHHSQVVTILDQAGFSKIWVLVGFDGSDTPASHQYQSLVENIKNLERMLKSVKVSNVRLNQEFRKMVNAQRQHLKENVELVNEARKGAPMQQPPMMEDEGYNDQLPQ